MFYIVITSLRDLSVSEASDLAVVCLFLLLTIIIATRAEAYHSFLCEIIIKFTDFSILDIIRINDIPLSLFIITSIEPCIAHNILSDQVLLSNISIK